MASEPSFLVSAAASVLIGRIADRAYAMDKHANGKRAQKLLDWRMDITACHANGNPLDLQRLLDADDFNFAHDCFGIARHLNRRTGELENCFSPRFHARGAVSA